MKIATHVTLLLFISLSSGLAGTRFASTIGTVHREIAADRVAFTLRVKAMEKTMEASTAKLEGLLADLTAEAAKLNYPVTAFTVKTRATEREWEWEEKKRIAVGFASSASVSVVLSDLTNYGKVLTFLGTNEGFEVLYVSLGSSLEGEARKQAITEALKAARNKAGLLAQEGGSKVGKLLEVTEEEVETRSFNDYPASANSRDPNEGKGVYPIGIYVRVRAKYELR